LKELAFGNIDSGCFIACGKITVFVRWYDWKNACNKRIGTSDVLLIEC